MQMIGESDIDYRNRAFTSCCEPDEPTCFMPDCRNGVLVDGETCPDCRRALQVIADAEQAAKIERPAFVPVMMTHKGACLQNRSGQWVRR